MMMNIMLAYIYIYWSAPRYLECMKSAAMLQAVTPIILKMELVDLLRQTLHVSGLQVVVVQAASCLQ